MGRSRTYEVVKELSLVMHYHLHSTLDASYLPYAASARYDSIGLEGTTHYRIRYHYHIHWKLAFHIQLRLEF